MGAGLRAPPRGYWALAPTLGALRRELVGAYPAVPGRLYGTIGDAAHQTRKSDHQPDQRGYVRALDIPNVEHDGPPCEWLARLLRLVGEGGSQRLNPGGYVIWNRKIASDESRWAWKPYTGENPHTGHLHVSCSRLPQFYSNPAPWAVTVNLANLRAAWTA